MVLIRSSSVFLWHAADPDRLIPVIPPPHTAAESASACPAGQRRAANAGAETSTLRYRAAQLAPGGDRIYLIDQSGQLHAWAIDGAADGPAAPGPGPCARLGGTARGGGLEPALCVATVPSWPSATAGTVTLFDTVRSRVLERIKPSNGEAESLLLALAFSPDGHDLAVGSQQGTISLWSVAQPTKPRLRLRLPGHKGLVTNLVFDAQGQRLASAAGIEPLVEVWNLDLLQHELARLGLAD